MKRAGRSRNGGSEETRDVDRTVGRAVPGGKRDADGSEWIRWTDPAAEGREKDPPRVCSERTSPGFAEPSHKGGGSLGGSTSRLGVSLPLGWIHQVSTWTTARTRKRARALGRNRNSAHRPRTRAWWKEKGSWKQRCVIRSTRTAQGVHQVSHGTCPIQSVLRSSMSPRSPTSSLRTSARPRSIPATLHKSPCTTDARSSTCFRPSPTARPPPTNHVQGTTPPPMGGAEQPDQGMGQGPRTPTRDAEKEPSRGGACIAATASRDARIRNTKEVEATAEIRRDWKGNGRTKRLSNDGERHVAWERMCRTQLKTMAWIGLCIWVKLGVAMTAKVTKSKPEISTAPLDIPPRVLMGPGPSSAYPRILSSSSLPLLGHMHPEFLTIMDDVKTWLKYSFQTDNKLTLAVSGSGHAAMEAAVANTIEPGDIVIVGVNGIWGQRLVDMCERYGAVVHPIHAEFGRVFSNQDVEAALQANPGTTAVILVHGESSTGTLQPLEGIGQMVRRHGALFILDAVCTLACVPLNVDEQMVDVVYSGSQKCLGAMPGASPLTMGARATAKLRSRKTKVRSYYLDMNFLGNYWGVDEDQPRAYHHTGLITNVYALREALAIVAEEGLEQAWDRHRSQAKALWDGLQKMGLELFVPDAESRLPTVTTVKVPAGVDWKAVSTYVMEKYSLEISGGLGPTAGQVWRIGIMGHNARPGNVAMMLSALEDALKHVKWTGLKPVGKTVVEKIEL